MIERLVLNHMTAASYAAGRKSRSEIDEDMRRERSREDIFTFWLL